MAKKQQTHLPQIQRTAFDFLETLQQNNNKDWFTAHKEVYLGELSLVEAFAEALLQELNTHDVIETVSGKKSLYRIYRDTRFSNNKTPYKNYFAGRFGRAARYRRGGYYFHIEPGNTVIAGGFYAPNAEDLKRIRDEVAYDAAPVRKILSSKAFVSTFGMLQGEQLKTNPRGYDKTHEAGDLLRYKQFLLIRKFTDEEVLSESFFKEACQTFKNMRPFFDYMSELLTTDANGLAL